MKGEQQQAPAPSGAIVHVYYARFEPDAYVGTTPDPEGRFKKDAELFFQDRRVYKVLDVRQAPAVEGFSTGSDLIAIIRRA